MAHSASEATHSLASFIESKLFSIEFDAADKSIRLSLRRPNDNEAFYVTFSGVEQVLIVGCQLLNVVEEAKIIDSANPHSVIENAVLAVLEELHFHKSVITDFSSRLTQQISKGDLVMFLIEPIYGARVNIICKKVIVASQ